MFKLERHDAFLVALMTRPQTISTSVPTLNEKASESIALLIQSQMLKYSVQSDMSHDGLAAVHAEKTELFGNMFSIAILPTSSSEGSMAA